MARYDSTFFDYVNAGSVRSARGLLPILLDQLQVREVLDVGCGQGAWLCVWQELGVAQVTGVDGDYVDRSRLLFPAESFVPNDLSDVFDLGRRFDFAMSLEVAEHLPAASAAGLVDSLVRHSDRILFSAAQKGQGGDNHVNEQGLEYWRELFARHGYIPIDYVRPRVLNNDRIEPWYRYNPLLYVAPRAFDELPGAVKACRIPDDQAVVDVSPPLYRLRKLLVGALPVSAMTWLAKIKERKTLRELQRSSS
jgi:SAM-dependent methyltransferase